MRRKRDRSSINVERPRNVVEWSVRNELIERFNRWLTGYGPGTEADRTELLEAVRRRSSCGSYEVARTRHHLILRRFGGDPLHIPTAARTLFIEEVKARWVIEDDEDDEADDLNDPDVQYWRNIHDPKA
jgi:hypothetical protein